MDETVSSYTNKMTRHLYRIAAPEFKPVLNDFLKQRKSGASKNNKYEADSAADYLDQTSLIIAAGSAMSTSKKEVPKSRFSDAILKQPSRRPHQPANKSLDLRKDSASTPDYFPKFFQSSTMGRSSRFSDSYMNIMHEDTSLGSSARLRRRTEAALLYRQ